MSLQAGQAFGNYRILSRIGVGGMGLVFLAEHPTIGKKVALKVIHRELAGNREVVSRFLNEARAVNQIGNEHIVEIHDFGQTDEGEHFFIMEYLEGRTLAADLVAHPGGLATPRGLHIGAQIASALATAHDRGIIHRDLKPDNVMLIERLGDPDFVKLLDFGLAKFLADADARKLTAAGVVLGTPQYMSPEACESRPGVDHRSDIYSLGILLFQMLTGVLPFEGDSMGEVLVKQVAHPPPALRAINPEVPPAVEQVVLRCLAKDPAARFQHMLELRDALLDPARYLASSPPVVAAAAAPDQRTMLAGRRRTEGRPAAAPPPAALPADARTIAAGMAPVLPPGGPGPGPGYGVDAAGRPTEIAMPVAHPPEGVSGPGPGVAPMGPGGPPAASAATAYMDGAAHQMFAGHMERHVPQPVENRTMVIGTPQGYKDHPPRRWPRVVLWLTLAGGAAALAALVAIPALSGGGEEAPAAAPAPDAGAAEVARIAVTTRPAGASIYDGTGRLLAPSTPAVIELPRGTAEVALVFRHPQAREREKRFVPDRDASLEVELLPLGDPPASGDAGPPAAAGDGGPGGASAGEPGGAGAAAGEAREAEPRPRGRKERRRKKPPSGKDGLLRPSF